MRLIDADAYVAEMKDRQDAAYKWREEAISEGDEVKQARAEGAFTAFVEAKLTMDKQPAASPWHRVEEELPEIGKAVVVSIYDDMWVATRLDDKRFNGRMYWELSDGSWERVENDMYWMPIDPPKEDA